MLKEEDKLSLTRMVDALPAWMEQSQAAKVLLEQAAQRALIAFVRVPSRSVVIEEKPLFPLRSPSFLAMARMEVPIISAAHRKEKNAGGDVIEHPVEKPLIGLLE